MRPPWWMRQLARLFRLPSPSAAASIRIDSTTTPWGTPLDQLAGARRTNVPLWVRWCETVHGEQPWIEADAVLRDGPWVVVVRNRTEHIWLNSMHLVGRVSIVFALLPPSAP